MIKKTLYFGNPVYLSLSNSQLVIKHLKDSITNNLPTMVKDATIKSIPIEDIGVVVLDNQQITITHGVIAALLDNSSAIVTCAKNSMPTGLMLPLDGNTLQSERFTDQINSSEPLRKQLWQQTIESKIKNQATLLSNVRGSEIRCMQKWASSVLSGDASNLEARAAVYYWANIFDGFRRDRNGSPPNNLLNYGYAILRAVVARALVVSGLLPTFGIHHHNRYNSYCLADDIMEPYRPYVDKLVVELYDSGVREINRDVKGELLSIPTLDVYINGKNSPLMVAVSTTTASLYKCYSKESRKIVYPTMI